MKVKRLLLCVLMSLMLTVTLIPMIAFAGDEEDPDDSTGGQTIVPGDGPDEPFSPFENLYRDDLFSIYVNGIPLSPEEKEAMVKFTPEETGWYMFYSKHTDSEADPAARVWTRVQNSDGNYEGDLIAEDYDSGGNRDFAVVFKATGNQPYYLHTTNLYKDTLFSIYIRKTDIKGLTFTPADGIHTVYASCEKTYNPFWPRIEEYLYTPRNNEVMEDKLILTGGNEYTYKEINGNRQFYDSDGDSLGAIPRLDSGQYSILKEGWPGGHVGPVYATVMFMGFETNAVFQVKYVYTHPDNSLVYHPAVAATCVKPGTEEYWTCNTCKKLFSDAKGVYEIKEPKAKKKPHDLVKTAAKKATYKAAGNKAYYTCKSCKKHFSDAKGTKVIKANSWIIKKLKPKAQKVKVTAKKKTVKAKVLKKKAVVVKPLTVKGAKGKVTYKIVGGNAKSKKALKINKKTGKVTVKKNTKAGTYTVKVRVNSTASANKAFKAFKKTVAVVIVVK